MSASPTKAIREHAAIVQPVYARAILAGRKTIEARLTVQRREPFGVAAVGERVFFKARGGAFFASARIARAEFHAELTPGKIASIRRVHNREIVAEPGFWREKRRARYATLLWLDDIVPVDETPVFRWAPRSGWSSRPARG